MNRGELKKEGDSPAELESQFILRLPTESARLLRELIQSGINNLKDRLSIRIENDMRTGEVRLDHMLLHAKVLDLPTIIESLKTIDNKTFYKTADICQIVICKEDEDQTTTDDETPTKAKKKDPNKVDKKYLYPHGVTPPMKNVRKRRFRKTLKKKYVEAPEIEKEVKRLLREDNEAVHVKWEVINEEEDVKQKMVHHGAAAVKEEVDTDAGATLSQSATQNLDVAEHDIFGGAVSDSEDEDKINVMEMEDTSRLSADSSRMSVSDSTSRGPGPISSNSSHLVTQFSKEMFSSHKLKQEVDDYEYRQNEMFNEVKSSHSKTENSSVNKDALKSRVKELEVELNELRNKRQQQEQEIVQMENMALRQRFQYILDNLLTELMQKEQEYAEILHLLQRM